MSKAKILAFAGSVRETSFNRTLLSLACQKASDAGGEVTVVDLKQFEIPLYDGDLEKSKGIPDGAQKLHSMLGSHDAILVASAEYNGSVSGVLKNAIGWISRPQGDARHLAGFKGKVAGLLAASPGVMGGFHGLVRLRDILGYILPEQVLVAKSHAAFDENGSLKGSRTLEMLDSLVASLVATT
ncbi:MAG: NAD(P)H-dependent oxidoreductase [Planctomycetota bacterium]